jgi:hypothetical protein
MSKDKKPTHDFLNPTAELRVVATRNGKETQIFMTVQEWKELKKKPGYTYLAYQK